MAETQNAQNACDAKIQLDSAAGALIDISGSSNNVDVEWMRALGEYKVFQQNWMKRLECGHDGSISLQVVYSNVDDEGFRLVNDWFFAGSGKRTLEIYTPDGNAGSDKWTGECRLGSWAFTLASDEAGPVLATAELSTDGEWTHSTVAS